MITQLQNDYSKSQQTYPVTVQKSQALLTAWEGDKYPVHRSNKGLIFAKVMNDDDSDGGAAGKGDTQASGARASRGGMIEARRCY